nr:MAG TPA: hypothetical protein [Caudoviricetes sp.]
MGYFTKEIAKESKTPAIVSLSSNPNYIQFESLNDPTENKHIDISLQILDTSVELSKTEIVIVETDSGNRHELKGTRTRANVNSNTFFVDDSKAVTAENIKACLMEADFFKGNFQITIPFINNVSYLDNGDTIKIYSLSAGPNVAFTFEKRDNSFTRLTGNPANTTNNDSIDGGEGDCELEIEIYRDTNIFLGVDDTPQNNQSIGTFVASLAKAYFNSPLWFDLNALIGSSKLISNDLLNSEDLVNTGTITDFRFTARKYDGVSRQPFYISNVLYTIKGFDRNLENNDLSEYVYNTQRKNIVKPLTKQPALFHIKGQTQYFNFILADPDRNINLGNEEYNLGILYKLYSQSKNHIADVTAHEKNRKLFNVANTISLDIDEAIGEYSNVGFIEVYLSRAGVEVSEPLLFRILPECLYKVNDFAFLNSLGGWSSFNFSGTETTDFKASTNTIYKTQTPSHTISSDIESVYTKETEEQFTAQTMPINKTVCDWLKELSSSFAVYELSTKRYIIVDELNIKPNTKDDLFRLEMKYHYSDRYNALIV